MQVNRTIAYQNFETFVLAVGTTPTPLSSLFTKADLIDSFTVSVDAAAANNVFIGGQAVTVDNGLEIVRGAGPVSFEIVNQNQHYEIQSPVIAIAEALNCRPLEPVSIPFIVWDLSQIYMVAAAATNVRVAPFRSIFI